MTRAPRGVTASIDPDMDVGGRVFLIDGFSAVAARVGRSFTSLRQAYAQGTRAVAGASRDLVDGFRRVAEGSRSTAASLQQTAGYRAIAGGVRLASVALHAMPGAVVDADRAVSRFGVTLSRVRAPLDSFDRGVRGALGGLGRVVSGMTGQLGGLAHFLQGPAGLASGFAALVGASSRAASSMENNRLAFTTLLGSAQLARDHLAELQQFAIGRPFEFADLVTQSRYLQTFGFGVGEVTGLLTDFGNAAFTANTGIRGVNTMSRVFGTMLATNKTNFGQLRQLVSAGIPAFQILRDELHLNDAQLQNIARSGIPAQQVIAALRRGMQGRFAGGMDRAAATITARLSDLQDVAGQFLTMVGDELRPVIGAFLGEFSGGLGTAAERMVLARRVAETLATGMRVLRGIVAIVGGAVTDLGERWNRGTGRMARSWTTSFAVVRDVTEGVVALLAGEDARGMARIPRSLQERLIRRGLWPLVLQIARWGDRVRQVVSGFLEGMAVEARRAGGTFLALAEGLGIGGRGMAMNRAEARQLGQEVARLVRGYVELRAVMFGLSVATQGVAAVLAVARLGTSVWSGLARGAALAGRALAWVSPWLVRAGGTLRSLWNFATALGRALGMAARGPLSTLLRYSPVIAAITATLAGTVLVWRHWNQLQANTVRAAGLRTLAGALLGPWYAAVALIKTAPSAWSTLVRGMAPVRRAFAAIGAWVAGAMRSAGAAVLRGVAWITAPFRLIGSMLVVANYVAFALLWARVRAPLAAFGRGVASFAARAAGAVSGFYLRLGQWSVMVVASARGVFVGVGLAIGQFYVRVGRVVGGAVVVAWGALLRLRGAVVGFFASMGARAWAFIAPLLARVVGLSVAIRTALGGAFVWVATAAQTAFGRLAEVILSPLRLVARQLVVLFRSLPRGLQPAALQGMVADLDTFGRSTDGPVGGPPPVPDGAQAGGAPPGPPPVPVSVRQQAAGQAAAAGRAGPAPVVQVTVPPSPPAPVQVLLDGRVLVTAVERRQEGERLRQGRSG